MFDGKNAIKRKCMNLEMRKAMGETSFPHPLWREKGEARGRPLKGSFLSSSDCNLELKQDDT